MNSDTINIKKIKLEIKLELLKRQVIEELNVLENRIRTELDSKDIQSHVLVYTRYAMKFLYLIKSDDQKMENFILKKLNSFIEWNKLKFATILGMQEMIDYYCLKMSC